jgi:hypothetical protein
MIYPEYTDTKDLNNIKEYVERLGQQLDVACKFITSFLIHFFQTTKMRRTLLLFRRFLSKTKSMPLLFIVLLAE